jgi:hypothetical protein
MGYEAGVALTVGTNNTLIGGEAGKSMVGDNNNTAVGWAALKTCSNASSTASNNTAVGYAALTSLNTGLKNTALGLGSGENITSGDNNCTLGVHAGITGSPGGNITAGNNEIALGNNDIVSFACKVSLTATSDERDKTDFKDLNLGLDFVNALKPVTYVWDDRANYIDKTKEGWEKTADLDTITSDGSKKDDDLQVGFKAQDVIALEDAAGYKLSDKTNLTASITSDGKQYGLMYERFVPMLVKAVQELSAKNDALEARLKKLEDG